MQFKIGFVGCGRIAKNHFDALGEEKRFQLVGVCDRVKDRAQSAAKEHGIPHFLKLSEMLDKLELDILAVCTPSGIHTQNGVLAAEHKLHVLTEKPMATRLKDADELIQACDRNHVQLFVVKQNRLNATI